MLLGPINFLDRKPLSVYLSLIHQLSNEAIWVAIMEASGIDSVAHHSDTTLFMIVIMDLFAYQEKHDCWS